MKDFVNHFLNRVSWGQFIVSKIQIVITLTIMLKVFNARPWAYAIVGIGIVALLYCLGWIFDRYLKEDYLDKYYGGYKFRS